MHFDRREAFPEFGELPLDRPVDHPMVEADLNPAQQLWRQFGFQFDGLVLAVLQSGPQPMQDRLGERMGCAHHNPQPSLRGIDEDLKRLDNLRQELGAPHGNHHREKRAQEVRPRAGERSLEDADLVIRIDVRIQQQPAERGVVVKQRADKPQVAQRVIDRAIRRGRLEERLRIPASNGIVGHRP